MNCRTVRGLVFRGLALSLCALMCAPSLSLAAALGELPRSGAASPAGPADQKETANAEKPVQPPPTQSGVAANGPEAAAQLSKAPAQTERAAYQPSSQRVGVNSDQVLQLSLHDAIVIALDKNLDIAVQRYSVKQSEYDLLSARGVYDIIPGASLRALSSTTPVASIFSGGSATTPTSTKTYTWNLNLQQNVPTGGNYRIDFNNNRVGTNRSDFFLNPQFTSSITFSYTQPLLRNFKIDASRRQIQIAKKQLDISDLQFRQRAIDTINSVQKAYWDLVFAIQNERIRRDALDLAATQLDNNRKRVDAGDLAPIEIVQAEATVESRKQDVIVALQNVTITENILKGLLLDDPDSPLWNSRVSPNDKAEFVPSSYNLDQALRLALLNRTDLLNLKSQVQLNQIDLRYYDNQKRPQFDVFSQFGSSGQSGTLLVSTRNPLTGQIISTTRTPLGGASDAISNGFAFDARNVFVGLTISFPVQNRTARALYGRAVAESRKLDLEQKRMIQQIQVDVRNAVQAVESARQRIEAAKLARVNAETQLSGEEQKYRAGLSTTFFVLQRQTDLSDARGRELQALTDYNKAIADLQRAMSTTLDSAGVKVSHDITTPDQNPAKKL